MSESTPTMASALPVPTTNSKEALPLIIQYDPDVATGASAGRNVGSYSNVQQPIQQQLAVFNAADAHKDGVESMIHTIHGASMIATNHQYVLYVVKNGLVRILSRSSASNQQKALLRFHQNENVSDLQFFQFDGELLASVSHTTTASDIGTSCTSHVMISRISSRMNEIIVDPMLMICNTSSPDDEKGDYDAAAAVLKIKKFIRVIWHPYSPNQFIIIYEHYRPYRGHGTTISAMVIETTKLQTTTSPQYSNCAKFDFTTAVQQFQALPTPPLCVITHPKDVLVNLTDVAFSTVRNNCIVVTYDNGDIIFFDLSQHTSNDTFRSRKLLQPVEIHTTNTGSSIDQEQSSESLKITRVLFLPHTNTVYSNNGDAVMKYSTCFITGSNNNASFTVWSPFISMENVPYPIQTLNIGASPKSTLSYLLNVCYGPPSSGTSSSQSCFILVSCREQHGMIYAFHLQSTSAAAIIGCDYVIPFRTQYPILSCDACVCPPTPSSNDADYDISRHTIINFDIKLFVYQTLAAQAIQMKSSMLQYKSSTAAKTNDLSPGVTIITKRITTMTGNRNNEVMDVDASKGLDDGIGFEEYDIDETIDDDEDDAEYDQCGTSDAPDPSTLPIPSGVTASAVSVPGVNRSSMLTSPPSSSLIGSSSNTSKSVNGGGNNPFANWLGGAFATPAATTISTTRSPIVPIPPTPTINTIAPEIQRSNGENSNTQATPTTTTLLSPMEILGLIPVSSLAPSRNMEHGSTPITGTNVTTIGNDDSVAILQQPPPTLQALTSSRPTEGTSLEPDSIINSSDESHRPSFVQKNSPFINDIRAALRDEINTAIAATIRSDLKDILQQPLTDAMKPLQAQIDQLQSQQQNTMQTLLVETKNHTSKIEERVIKTTTSNLDECMRAMFTECMRTVLIPTIESVTTQVFAKVSERLETLTLPMDSKSSENKIDQMDSMSQQIQVMSNLMLALSKEVKELRNTIQTSSIMDEATVTSTVASTPKQTIVDPFDQQRKDILQNIKDGNFEAAIRRGVSNKTVDMALFCCRNISIDDVFGNAQPKVSQPILLCLMQQLGTVIDTIADPMFILNWLQEVALSLHPPTIPEIRPHIPGVVQNLQSQISKRMNNPNNTDAANIRRSLQKLQSLLRSMVQ